jgi:hypothetical protein
MFHIHPPKLLKTPLRWRQVKKTNLHYLCLSQTGVLIMAEGVLGLAMRTRLASPRLARQVCR